MASRNAGEVEKMAERAVESIVKALVR